MRDYLNEPVLILNKNWCPVETCTVRDAFCHVCSNRARFLTADTYALKTFDEWAQLSAKDKNCIRTAHLYLEVPEIIIISTDGGLSRVENREIIFSKENLLRRDNFTCQYCGKKLERKTATIEHVTPCAKGGLSTWTNCILACLECNQTKGNKYLHESDQKLLKAPYVPKWSPVFRVPEHKRKKSWIPFIKNKVLEKVIS